MQNTRYHEMEGDILYILTVGSSRCHVGPRAELIRRFWQASHPSFGTYTIMLRTPPAAPWGFRITKSGRPAPFRCSRALSSNQILGSVTRHDSRAGASLPEIWSRSDPKSKWRAWSIGRKQTVGTECPTQKIRWKGGSHFDRKYPFHYQYTSDNSRQQPALNKHPDGN